MKIKDVRTVKIKLVEYLGEVEPAWTPGWASQTSTIGGYNFTEIELENGEIGIGPSCNEIVIENAKEYLVGKSPENVAEHYKYMIYRSHNSPYNGLAGIDIALWDLKGKINNKPISQQKMFCDACNISDATISDACSCLLYTSPSPRD